ncbi:MAG TPA: Spy/CpxP family protein refolding chaperone [Terriglobales bacterium]|nr:Spy/CpxP family protein refolding chaperone [Terriglobales bacterium]
MKIKLIVVLLATVFAMADRSFSEVTRFSSNAQPANAESDTLASVLDVPSATPRGPQDLLQEYEAAMRSITQQFSARLAVIAGAVHSGELTTEQAESISSEQYQQAQMQFDLLSALREILQQDIARAAAAPRVAPSATVQNEIVMVALPFSSLQLNPSIIEYLDLSSAQVTSIEQLMSDERRSLVPLMAQMQETREQLLSVTEQSQTKDDKEVKALAATQARNLSKLIVSNSRMRTKIYQLLSPTQQKKLDEFQRQ